MLHPPELLSQRTSLKAGFKPTGAVRSLRSIKAQAASSSSRVGERIQKWLQSPFDIAAFGPRATLGALLTAPERIQNLQSDLQQLGELVQDSSRETQEKKQVVLEEIEMRLTDCLERGATVEADILANLKAVLPQQIADAIPQPTLPSMSTVEPIPEVAEGETAVEYTSESVAASQTSAEMTGIESEVATLKANLSALRANLSPSRENMLKLNLRESRDRLEGLLKEMTSSELDDVVSEARALLQEVDAEL